VFAVIVKDMDVSGAGLVARRGANSLQVRKPEEQPAGPMTKAGMTPTKSKSDRRRDMGFAQSRARISVFGVTDV
jgi:hypothetical protein